MNPRRSFLQHLSLLVLAVALRTTTVFAADSPFVFRDVASGVGLHEPMKGAIAHAAAWGEVSSGRQRQERFHTSGGER
jgi:hypothetical protein